MNISQAPTVSPEFQFVFLGSIWPREEDIERRAIYDAELFEDTVEWIEAVLKPERVAPDLRERLRAVRAIVNLRDAFLTRYSLDGARIQIVVDKYSLHLVIAPERASVAWPVFATMHEFLQVDLPSDATPWTGDPWLTLGLAGFTWGYQSGTSSVHWRESTDFLTSGIATKFSIRKVTTRLLSDGPPKTTFDPSEEAARHWFEDVRE